MAFYQVLLKRKDRSSDFWGLASILQFQTYVGETPVLTCLRITKVVRSSGLRNSLLVYLVHCSLAHRLFGVQTRLLLKGQSEVVRGRVDPERFMGLKHISVSSWDFLGF